MHVQCGSCESTYNIDDNKIPDKGAKVECKRCQHIIVLTKTRPETNTRSIEEVENTNEKENTSESFNKVKPADEENSVSAFQGNRILKIAGKTISFICLIVAMIFFSTCGKIIARKAFSSSYKQKQNAEIQELLQDAAKEIKSQLPLMVDEETQLDSVLAVKNQIFCRYTMVNYKSTEIDAHEFEVEAKKLAKHNTCSNENTKKLLQLGANYVFIYFGKDGYKIARVLIDSKSCED